MAIRYVTPDTPAPSPTGTPQPAFSPTLGPLISRTPAPSELCPERSSGVQIEPAYDSEEMERRILGFLNRGGAPEELGRQLSVPGEDPPTLPFPKVPYVVADVHTIDVTGDQVDDLVVYLAAGAEEEATAILVFACRQGVFQAAFAHHLHTVTGDIAFLAGVIEMNGDGVPEIVYSIEESGASGGLITDFYILEWDGQAFAQRISNAAEFGPRDGAEVIGLARLGDQRYYAQVPTDLDRAFPDVDGNGTRELGLIGGPEFQESGAGPMRDTVDTWAWNGQAFTLRSSEFEPPEYRFQAARDGDAATRRSEYEKALAFYQQAVFDEELLGWNRERLGVEPYDTFLGTPTPPPSPDERPRLNAYGRYRILLLHAAQGGRDAATIVYRTLKEKVRPGTPGFPYVLLADAFWEGLQSGGSVATGCERARTYAAEHPDEVLVPLGSSVYGFLYEDYTPSDMCPFD